MDSVLSIPSPARTGTDLLAPLPRTRGDLEGAQSSFASILGRAGHDASRSDQQRAREAAQDFIAQTFIQPILKQFRESDRTAPPFGPSQGEKQFRALMDVELAQRIVRAQHFPLVDRLAQDLLRASPRYQQP